MHHNFLIHSSGDGHLGCIHVLAIINSAAVNSGVHMSLSILVSLVCMPSSGVARPYGSSISSFLRNLYTVLLESTSLKSPTLTGLFFTTVLPGKPQLVISSLECLTEFLIILSIAVPTQNAPSIAKCSMGVETASSRTPAGREVSA